MKYKSQVLGASLVLALCAGTAYAGPQNGFSINGGLISSNTSTTVTGGFFNGLSYSYSGAGLSLGIDYQFALGNNFSLNPFLMTSGETISGLGSNIVGGHAILGLQARLWLSEAMFVGGHIGSYSETLSNPNMNLQTSASGPGAGLVVGWENPYTGVYVMGQVDSATLNYAGTDTKLTDARLSIGYRWK